PSVKLNFSHALSKIKAIFTTDFPPGFMVYVSNIYVTDFYNRADFNVSSSTWSNYTGEENNTQSVMLSVPDNSFVENKTGSKITSSEAFVIPKLYDATGCENVRLHFTINVMKDDEIIMERKIVGTWSPQWEKSKIYTYNIKISGTSAGILPIVFSDVQDLYGAESWEDSRPLDMMFGIETN
ncbi:MAG: fimbrillin family protein, partial [Paramuribaculum sp.]|nr:fimbrillin family protein [Paramuribaculum sp.]